MRHKGWMQFEAWCPKGSLTMIRLADGQEAKCQLPDERIRGAIPHLHQHEQLQRARHKAMPCRQHTKHSYMRSNVVDNKYSINTKYDSESIRVPVLELAMYLDAHAEQQLQVFKGTRVPLGLIAGLHRSGLLAPPETSVLITVENYL